MDTINFAPGSGFQLVGGAIRGIVEAWSVLGNKSTVRDFEIEGISTPVIIDSVVGTYSFFGMNWSWRKRLLGWFGMSGGQSTALCGFIGSSTTPMLAFDFQGLGGLPINKEVSHYFPNGVLLDKVHFDMYPDMALPTNFRAALVFHIK